MSLAGVLSATFSEASANSKPVAVSILFAGSIDATSRAIAIASSSSFARRCAVPFSKAFSAVEPVFTSSENSAPFATMTTSPQAAISACVPRQGPSTTEI